jgi:hypothetical protein
MARHLKKQKTTNGCLHFTKGVGNFGTDYLLRGMANLLTQDDFGNTYDRVGGP